MSQVDLPREPHLLDVDLGEGLSGSGTEKGVGSLGQAGSIWDCVDDAVWLREVMFSI